MHVSGCRLQRKWAGGPDGPATDARRRSNVPGSHPRNRPVEFPQSAEARVKTLRLHCRQLGQETLAPGAKGQCVGVAEILLGDQLQVAGARFGGHDRVDRWDEAAREYIALDVIDAAPGLFVAVVLDGDGLQQGNAIRLEQALQRGHVGVQVFGADRFDHLDRHQLVELALQVAVVLHQQRDLVLQARLPYAPGGQRMLFCRDGGGRDMAAIVPGGMDRETTPAGADFHHAVAGFELQLLADAVQLAPRGRFEWFGLTGEQRRRVHQVRRQEQGKEIVAQVIVRGDVAAAALTAVPAQAVPAPQQPATHAGRATLHAVQQVAIAYQQPDQCHQIITVPFALDVAFTCAHTALRCNLAIEPRVIDGDGDMQFATGIAQPDLAQCVTYAQATVAHGGKLGQQAAAQERIQGAGARQGDQRGHRVHRGFSARAGWSCTGLRFIHSRSACQWMAATTWWSSADSRPAPGPAHGRSRHVAAWPGWHQTGAPRARPACVRAGPGPGG